MVQENKEGKQGDKTRHGGEQQFSRRGGNGEGMQRDQNGGVQQWMGMIDRLTGEEETEKSGEGAGQPAVIVQEVV